MHVQKLSLEVLQQKIFCSSFILKQNRIKNLMKLKMSDQIHHDSAIKHVTGESIYINDMLMSSQLLLGKVVFSKYAHANIKKINIKKALKVKGVHAVIIAKDIPGKNQMGPVVHDESCLAEKIVIFVGQAIVLIAAENKEALIQAEKLIEIEYEVLDKILDIETSIAKNNILAPQRKIERGNVDEALKNSPHTFKGELKTNGQEH